MTVPAETVPIAEPLLLEIFASNNTLFASNDDDVIIVSEGTYDENIVWPDKNIELGCAYIAKIRYVYYKDITDDEKAINGLDHSRHYGVNSPPETGLNRGFSALKAADSPPVSG